MKKLTLVGLTMVAMLFAAASVLAQQKAAELTTDPQNAVLNKNVSHSEEGHSFGPAPAGNAAPWVPGTPFVKLPGSKAYAYNAFSNTSTLPAGPMHFILNNPAAPVSLANQANLDFVAAASWANGIWYGATYNATAGASLVKIDTATGGRTTLGLIGLSITGMAYDWTTNVMYALAYVSNQTRLYTINLTNGQPTLVANVGAFLGICLGCTESGALYTVNVGTDNLCSIDKMTGVFTVIGPIGFNANYAQDMEFDNSDSTMYYAAYRDSVGGQLRTVNLQTGATTLIGAFDGNMEVTGLAIRNLPFPVADHDLALTLLNNPVSGYNLTAAEPVTVTIKNMGANAESGFNMVYQIDANPPVTEVYTDTIAPGATEQFTFTATADFSSPGTDYNLIVYHALAADEDNTNDTIHALIQNLYGVYCPAGSDSCDEHISRVQLLGVDNVSGCSQATNGYANYDTISAAMTYGQSATIMVYNGPPAYNGDVCGIWIDWNHNGNFLDDEPVTVSGGPAIFNAQIHVPNQALAGEARMRIRVSYQVTPSPCGFDPFGEVEDYMIDVSGTPVDHDLGVIALVEPVSGPNLPSNAQVVVDIKNYGAMAETGFGISFVLDGGAPVTETVAATVAPGAVYQYTFTATSDVSAPGDHDFTVYTTLAADTNTSNDTLMATVNCFVVGNLIYDNGPLVNSPGTGFGGADESILQGGLGMTLLGSNNSLANLYRHADEFVVPPYQTWNITGASFYCYQTNSTTTSTINQLNFRIWNGTPPGGTVVFGDATTNRLSATAFSNIYRVSNTTSGNTQRPIMKNDCNIPTLTLGPGTYWVDWQTGGTLASGPWTPCITINGQTTTGNALQYVNSSSTWQNVLDEGSMTQQGLPFKLYGSIIVGMEGNPAQENQFSIYPNPASRTIHIQSSAEMISRLVMLNSIGQTVMETHPSALTSEITVSSLPAGVYVLLIETPDGRASHKVMVE
ncbi:MAG TPA: GEVED domain-containing protein [Bacteroidales bacterium]|nr:GEVED domain-containing protein [Bacteroidales bacterium]HSA42976.1 GEVED domain-containing protein [Bacteroidales bacterium]